MKTILFLTNPARQCGVAEFGFSTAKALSRSRQYRFVCHEMAETTSPAEYCSVVSRNRPAAIVYNWHPATMPWLNDELMRKAYEYVPDVKHAGIVHDEPPAFAAMSAIIHPDPLFTEHGRDFKVGRLVPTYTPKTDPLENVIGSFGFGFGSKGFVRVVDQVNLEFETATIRLHIPANFYCDPDGNVARSIVQACCERAKPGVVIEASHDFKSKEDLLDWLAGNAVNCFFYDELAGRGISSVIDLALTARRPIAITNSAMFRHVAHADPPILIERASLREIIGNGLSPLEPFTSSWSEEKLAEGYERILGMIMQSVPVDLTGNRVLTPNDREQLRPVVEELFMLEPDIMSRKIPLAVFQNAFLFQQARVLAEQTDRIMVIGGFEDPIGPALRKLGYDVTITDPMLDGKDMETVWIESIRNGTAYELVICCSVIEHVENDARFVRQMYQILKPSGRAILTTDYFEGWKEGMPKPTVDIRLYGSDRLRMLASHLPPDSLTDRPSWGEQVPYFEYESVRYSFCSFAFHRKVEEGSFGDYVRAQLIERTEEQDRHIEQQQRQVEALVQRVADLQAQLAPYVALGPTAVQVARKLRDISAHFPTLSFLVKRISQRIR